MKNLGQEEHPHLDILISIIIGKHMKMFCFKVKQSRTIIEDNHNLGEGGGRCKRTPIYIFESRLLLVNI